MWCAYTVIIKFSSFLFPTSKVVFVSTPANVDDEGIHGYLPSQLKWSLQRGLKASDMQIDT